MFSDTAEKARYQNAARSFRIPYWDWSVAPKGGGSVYPPDFKTEKITVFGPRGWQTIENPLYAYRFHPLQAGVFNSYGVSYPASSSPDPEYGLIIGSLTRGTKP